MQRLAVLGGTFNPVHLGHLILAETALTQFNLDQVLWVPSRYAHYKASAQILDFSHRVEMIQRAIASRPEFVLPFLQQADVPPSYAIHLFQQLQTQYPKAIWHWIIGLDALQTLPRWYGRQTLIQNCIWLIAPRFHLDSLSIHDISASASADATSLHDWTVHQTQRSIRDIAHNLAQERLELQWRSLQTPILPVSSQMIRNRCQKRQSIRYLVPAHVYDYITDNQLYPPL